jgi:hypothetical protein
MSGAENDPAAVQDYIAGRMSDSDREVFEAALLKDPHLVRDLEESLRLREGLAVLREQGVLGELRHPRRRAFSIGVAAAAVAVVVVGVGRYHSKRSAPIVAASVAALGTVSNRPPVVVKRYSFATVREASSTLVLGLPSNGALELRALTPVTEARRTFRVSLEEIRNQKASRIGFAEQLAADAEGFVVIYADASQIKPGDYALVVEPDDAGEAGRERFTFALTQVPGGS